MEEVIEAIAIDNKPIEAITNKSDIVEAVSVENSLIEALEQ